MDSMAAVFCDISKANAYDVEKRLRWIQENSKVTGIHLIVLDAPEKDSSLL